MKKTNNLTRTKGKVLFTSAAAITLSLVAANPDKVSAATQPVNQAAKKTANIAKKGATKKATIQPTTLTTENDSEAVPNDSSNEEENSLATDKNEVDSSSSDLSAAEPNDTSVKIEKRDSAPAERTVSGQVNGLNLSYNLDTDELSIAGGTYDLPQGSNGLATWKFADSNISLANAKKISITAKTKLRGSATTEFFKDFTELTEITGLDLLDTSEAIYMNRMFSNCPKLTSLDLSSLNTSKVESMDGMFTMCTGLKQINLQGLDTKKVTGMSLMFDGDSALTEINMSGLEATELESVQQMFNGCSALTEFALPFETPKLAYAAYMFNGCTNLRKLDISKLDLVSSGMALGNQCVDHMLGNLPNLNTIVLGPRSPLAIMTKYASIDSIQWDAIDNSALAFDSKLKQPWQQVDVAHGGTVFEPKGKSGLTVEKLTKLYVYQCGDDPKDFKSFPSETYVRLSEPITLHHVDESGKSIMADTVFRGPIGDSYSLNAEQIPGYNLVSGDKTFSGNYGDKREVTAIYAKIPASTAAVTTPVQAADVTVHYQDENGKTIAPDEVLRGNVGDGYTSVAKALSGYTLKARPDNATGFFSASPQSVTYVYAQEATSGAGATAGKGKHKKKNKGGKIKHTSLASNGTSSNNSALANTQADHASDPGKLPQTGASKTSQAAILATGALLIMGGIAGAWFSRKKD